MNVGVLLKALSISSTMLAVWGAMENVPADILAIMFGLAITLAWIAKNENKNGSTSKMSLNFPTEELKKGLTIREIQ